MSWLSNFLRPGDAPRTIPSTTQSPRLLSEPISQSAQSETITLSKADFEALRAQHRSPPTQEPNRNRNKIIFGAGVAFFALSLLVTRRAFLRRKAASTSTGFYTNAPAHREEQAKNVSGAMEAVEALNIATINVLSVALMATGGTLWYLDINGLEDGKRFIRGGLGVDGTGRSEGEVEEDFEVWLATTLAKKEAKTGAVKENGGSRILEEVERSRRKD
jgi:hypothetical protein